MNMDADTAQAAMAQQCISHIEYIRYELACAMAFDNGWSLHRAEIEVDRLTDAQCVKEWERY